MYNLNNKNTKLPAEGPKHKCVRKSHRLQEKYEQKGQVDSLPTNIIKLVLCKERLIDNKICTICLICY